MVANIFNDLTNNALKIKFYMHHELTRGNHSMPKLTLKEMIINRQWCKGCGICIHFCPEKVLGLDEEEKAIVLRPENCTCCKLCEFRCPDLAIEVITT